MSEQKIKELKTKLREELGREPTRTEFRRLKKIYKRLIK